MEGPEGKMVTVRHDGIKQSGSQIEQLRIRIGTRTRRAPSVE